MWLYLFCVFSGQKPAGKKNCPGRGGCGHQYANYIMKNNPKQSSLPASGKKEVLQSIHG
jgi:hypothetical protein